MKKYKAYLTMEFTADVEADSEGQARDLLANRVVACGIHNAFGLVKNIKVKRYWGGGNEVDDEQKQEVLLDLIFNYATDVDLYIVTLQDKELDEKYKREIYANVAETAGKIQLAIKDLKKEMQK